MRRPIKHTGSQTADSPEPSAEQKREQLRHAQKMESLGQLAGGIAHDFNNMLAIILGNLDFLNERVKRDDPLREFIKPSIEAAEHGSELTQRLLAFGQRQALQPKNIAVCELVEQLSKQMTLVLGERIEIVKDLEPDLWAVHIDPQQLKDALHNLSLNARDAMPDGGKLMYEAKNVIFDAEYAVRNPDVTPGQYVELAVSDTGEGMAPEVMERAFEPFYTTRKVGKGSGLGLSMVYGFIKQSRGHIKLCSEPGKGTSVKIYLPRDESTISAAPSMKKAQAVSGGGKSRLILVVEDNLDVLNLTSAMVENMGYKILIAASGDAALDILQERSDIDLLLSDVMLAGSINGPELAKKAVKMHPGLKVLFNSGYAEHAMRQSGMLEGGFHLISKPFRKHELAQKIGEVLSS